MNDNELFEYSRKAATDLAQLNHDQSNIKIQITQTKNIKLQPPGQTIQRNVIENENGQVSFFIALSFQILFVFFAMVVNVGLLVHHKINLQNSVDMAAYYGASKQAEMLNAIAHINYQMRQSLKLLAWRYRMVGSAGDQTFHPAKKDFSGGGVKTSLSFNPDNLDFKPDCDSPIVPTSAVSASLKDKQNDFFCRGVFCANYYPLKPSPTNQSFCQNVVQKGIKIVDPSQITGSAIDRAFPEFDQLKQTAVDAYQSIINTCKPQGTLNFLTLSRMIIGYKYDIHNRSFAIVGLSRLMSEKTDDFVDIEGSSVNKGVQETLRKNLTSANKDGEVSITFYNSLGNDACNNSSRAPFQPPKWLNRLDIYPSFFYTDMNCATDVPDQINVENKVLFPDTELPSHFNDPKNSKWKAEVLQNKDMLGMKDPSSDTQLFNPALGYEKNPWCMAYVGVSAVTMPKIPFSLGGVKLAARAFAKPFGGRIGPWYGKSWKPDQFESDSAVGNRTDLRMTVKYVPGKLPSKFDPRMALNFGLYPNDQRGLADPKLVGYYGEAIYLLDPVIVNGGGNPDLTASPSLLDWWHLIGEKSGSDKLAWNSEKNEPSPMRWLELSIVAPNLFDTTYYSIEPDFYHRYFLKLEKNNQLRTFLAQNRVKLEPDIGYRNGYKAGDLDLTTYGVRNQISDVEKRTNTSGNVGLKKFYSRIDTEFKFILKDWKHLLTSWSEADFFEFSKIDNSRFGKCETPALGVDPKTGLGKPEVSTSGQCIVGGSTGYHVKLISNEYLGKSDLNLGGEGVSVGPILNPPPKDDSDWFPNLK